MSFKLAKLRNVIGVQSVVRSGKNPSLLILSMLRLSIVFAAAMITGQGANALPITINGPFMHFESRAINSLGYTIGQYVRMGAGSSIFQSRYGPEAGLSW